MGLQLDDIRALMQDLENSSLREFSLQSDDFSLHLSKNEITQPVVTTPAQPTVASVATAEVPVATEHHPLDKEQKQFLKFKKQGPACSMQNQGISAKLSKHVSNSFEKSLNVFALTGIVLLFAFLI